MLLEKKLCETLCPSVVNSRFSQVIHDQPDFPFKEAVAVFVVIDIGDGPMELVNPEITMKEGEQRESEGCLSLPGKYGVTVRPMKVQVKAQDRNGKWQVFTGEGLKARAFCHEIDHLDGILFTSHVVGELQTQ